MSHPHPRHSCASLRRTPAAILLWAALLATALLLTGCRDDAESFFSGRPSEMALVHNRIIGGPPETMLVLLQVPARFPDATADQVALWQESAIAWWRNADKHELMRRSWQQLSAAELRALQRWVQLRDPQRSADKARTLDEIAAALPADPTQPREQTPP